MDFSINFDFLKYCIKRLFISTAEFLGPPLGLGPAVSASLASPHPCPWREGAMAMTVLGAPLQAGAKGRDLFCCSSLPTSALLLGPNRLALAL